MKGLINMTNTNILSALVQAEMEMPTPRKNAVNPHFNSKYSTLQELLRCVKPALLRHRIRMKMDIVTRENEVGAKITLQHISGEIVENEPVFMPVQKCTPQGRASAITYAQRYAICACFSLAGLESDDDANIATGESTKATVRVPKRNSEKNESLRGQTGMPHRHDSLDITNERQRFFGIATNKGLTDKKMKALAFYHFNKLSRSQLTAYEFKHLSDMLERENHASILRMLHKAKEMREAAFPSSA
jgi:hypothetical protein